LLALISVNWLYWSFVFHNMKSNFTRRFFYASSSSIAPQMHSNEFTKHASFSNRTIFDAHPDFCQERFSRVEHCMILITSASFHAKVQSACRTVPIRVQISCGVFDCGISAILTLALNVVRGYTRLWPQTKRKF
jgi:hypothetical protein